MVTDKKSNYTSPAGKEFTLTAGRFAGIHPASTVLDIGCGYGEGVCTLAEEFRCKAVAVDISRENIDFARDQACQRRVSHLITFIENDILKLDFSERPFDLIIAEGGIVSFMGRSNALIKMRPWLVSRGWVEFSDLLLLSDKAPTEILNIFEHDKYIYETEASYRKLIEDAGYSIQFMSLVPPSGWDNYYAHMARRMEENKGFFSENAVKLAFHKEIDIFYRYEGFRFIGYVVCIMRKKD